MSVARTSHRQTVRGVNMSKYLWLCVEPDEYELPLAVADTARELAMKMGTSKANVENNAWRENNGVVTGRRYLKIRKDEL